MDFKRSIVSLLAVLPAAFASPIQHQKRAYSDADILNYALTLEHLEDKFYRDGLANFTQQNFVDAGYDAQLYQNFVETAYDENVHVNFLTQALQAAGAPAVKECVYNFGVTNVQSFITTASILEGVGVSAYLGAAGLISSKDYLTAAGSILSSEARHNAYLRGVQKQSPFAQPFGAPLDFNGVYTLAAPFIVSCPQDNPAFLPVKAFPSLKLGPNAASAVTTNSSLTIQADIARDQYDSAAKHDLYAAWVSLGGPIFVPAVAKGDGTSFDITVPDNIHGQSFILLTNCNKAFTDDTIIAGPLNVEVSGSDGSPQVGAFNTSSNGSSSSASSSGGAGAGAGAGAGSAASSVVVVSTPTDGAVSSSSLDGGASATVAAAPSATSVGLVIN